MTWEPTYKPRLRPVEAFRLPDANNPGNEERIGLSDPTGISEVVLTMSLPALRILSMMDGMNTCDEIIHRFSTSQNQKLSKDTFTTMLNHLQNAHFLEGTSFEIHYQSMITDYRNKRIREMPNATALGIVDGSGQIFDDILMQAEPTSITEPLRGAVAPHLDYPRGTPCYAQTYASLQNRSIPDRVVILGTNHFGLTTSIVTTANDFQTPLGITRSDQSFINKIEGKCGDLRQHELDHAREHSIELQVAWLQHLYGADQFEMAAFLCYDPCGPNDTASYDGKGVDLNDFARALSDTLSADEKDTLIIAGADLSHVGENFGDNRRLDDSFLQEVNDHDRKAIAQLKDHGPDAFVQYLSEKENYTRFCSAGCIFVLAKALPDTSIHILRYHQAVDHSKQTCVTCATIAIT